MTERMPALAAITADLKCGWRRRWRAWLAWTSIELVALVLVLSLVHPRADLLSRPAWRLGLELAGWAIALAAVPVLALGLWHPATVVRGTLALLAAIAVTIAATGGAAPLYAGDLLGTCGPVVGIAALVATAALVLAGAAAPARSRAAAGWLGFAVALTGFQAATTVCPGEAWAHVVIGHALPAVGLAVIVAMLVRARRRRACARARHC